MRDAIRSRLLLTIPEILDVYEPHAAGADSPKPYAVVLQGEDTDESPWAGFRRIVEVWPYVSRSTFETIDALDKKIVAALDKQMLTTEAGEVFSCIYLGSAGQDVVDEEWDAITRGLRFAVMALQSVGSPQAVTSDPWLTALGEWTTLDMGPEWTVYNGVWPLGYSRPAVMWRVTSIGVDVLGMGSFRVTKRFAAHVIGTDINEELAGMMRLVESVGNAVKIPLHAAERRFMTVLEAKGNANADAMREGQITITLSMRTARPTEEAPLMQTVNYKSNMR